MTTEKVSLIACCLLTASAALGCGGEPEFAESPQPTASTTPPPAPAPPPPPPPPPEPTAGPCDQTQTQGFASTFQGRVATEAPGMEPYGAMICSVVPEGQSAAGDAFLLEPGYCYTGLGQGMPDVTEVDMAIEVDMSLLPPALAALQIKPQLAVDSQTGVLGAIHPGKTCYKWPFPIGAMVKLTVTAKQGGGPVAAQLYRKKAAF